METKSVILYGFHAVESAVRRNAKNVVRVSLERGRNDARMGNLKALLTGHEVAHELAERDMLTKMAGTDKHQGVVAEYRAHTESRAVQLEDILQKESVLLLVLDGVQDPHNLGACLRSAAGAGADAVIIPKDKSAPLTPAARKAASGAAEMIPLIYVPNIAETLRKLKKAKVWCIGADASAETDLYDADLKGRTALVLGAEGEGLRRLTRETCDSLVKIPMRGDAESLNVSVAAGILLFEAVRQRLILKQRLPQPCEG